MKPLLVGKYMLGPEFVSLYLTDGRGGSFMPVGDIGHDFPVMHVGCEHDRWQSVFQVLLHEAMEASAYKARCHYRPSEPAAEDMNMCLMVMHHHEFSEICGRAGMFINACAFDLSKAWKKLRKDSKNAR